MTKTLGKLILIIPLVLFFSCAAGVQENLDKARFALDKGNYSVAKTNAEAALTADATDVEAALLLASAYAGLAGIELTNVAGDIMDTAGVGGDNDDFEVIRAAFASILDSDEKVTNLDNAIESLRPDSSASPKLSVAPASTSDQHANYSFQLGMLQTIQAFALPSLKAQPAGTTTITLADIVATTRASTETSFLEADDNLVNANLDDNDLVTTLRQNFCVLKGINSATTAGQAFSLAELQDMIACQLDAAGSSVAPTTTTCIAIAALFSGCSGSGDTSL